MLSFAATALLSSAASAIIGGHGDSTAHPYVGAVDLRPAGFYLDASGVLVSPTVFVTAGHVTSFFERAGLTRARVTFDPVADSSSTWYWGTVHTSPWYNPAHEEPQDDPNDIGVIVFDDPIPNITPALLPPSGYLDRHGATDLQEVGYGVSERTGAPNDRRLTAWTGDGTRRMINSSFKSAHGGWLDLAQIDGNTCRGDSGGPAMANNIAVAIHKLNSGGNFCTGDGHDMRLDTADHRAFLGHYVTLP